MGTQMHACADRKLLRVPFTWSSSPWKKTMGEVQRPACLSGDYTLNMHELANKNTETAQKACFLCFFTWSSSPWKKTMGEVKRSACLSGDRSSYRS